MCGIYGIISKKAVAKFSSKELNKKLQVLFKQSLARGSEAAGLAILNKNQLEIIKINQNCHSLLTADKKLLINLNNNKIQAIFGQTRMATHGNASDQKNNQPVISAKEKIVGVHNGIITNQDKLLKNKNRHSQLDTQVLLDYLEEKLVNKKNINLLKEFHRYIKKIEGTVNLALLFPTFNKFILYSNHGSLYFFEEKNTCFFASESKTLELLNKRAQIKQLKQQSLLIDLNEQSNNNIKIIQSQNSETKKNVKKTTNSIEKLRLHTIDQQKINAIPRCSKCILPSTTPFISFNQTGVCNYCLEHQKIKYKGQSDLEKILSQYRKNSNKPDCLVAFSGGRDSSYGLHLIKKELGMNPLAFTYDWGMISDLGRRNQARMLSKLGVEQILISANIAKKRKHIRQNILAWLKKPNLGMVPLFMQGDKQCEYYADKIMKKYNIPLMIYCRGNELEKEEFKAGHCGIKEADPGGVIHNLSTNNKIKLLGFYGKEYLLNPAYINESIFDTAFGYFSTYLKPHNYLYLWHYLAWNEEEIVKTLTKEYDWELSPDTPTSWRIGDGTPAFYNYIYYQVQGFTENDSLRARQVREGILTRDKALELVRQENQPQYNNLKWYFDTLDLDGDMVLKKVDEMKKRYET